MSLIINTNTIATQTRNYLATNQSNLQRSLGRLASGSRIVKPSDDAGGLAVGNKLTATLNRNVRAQQNVSNSISFLQVQDGALASVGKILDRMSELKTMSLDVTKNSLDIANYDAEFNQLQDQLSNIREEKFNGINLFTTSADPLTTYTTEVGKGVVTSGTAAVAQVDRVTITAGALDGSVPGGATYSVTIDGVTTTVTEGAEINNGDNAAAIATALATAIGAQATDNGDGTLDITSATAGTAQVVSSATTDTGAAATADSNVTPNAADTRVFDGPAVELTRNSVFETGTDGNGLITNGTAAAGDGIDLTDSSTAATQNLADYSVDDFVTFIQNAATARANNGAQMSRLEQSLALLTTNHANIEGARSRLMDVDIATESTHFAKHNILVQSSAAMLAQANAVPNVALQLLG